MKLKFVTLDVFTESRFEGNPLALVYVPATNKVSQEQKQAIAREFNLSETVFLHEQDGLTQRKLDIFIPTAEIPFAGHPTIGTICYIGAHESNLLTRDLSLAVKAGTIDARFDGPSGQASADIPHDVHTHASQCDIAALHAAQPALQKLLASDAPPKTFPLVSIVRGMTFALIELPSVETHLAAVRAAQVPVPEVAARMDPEWAGGVLGYLFFVRLSGGGGGSGAGGASQPLRLRTRMVMADIGEDPATGSASGALAAYLALQEGRPDQRYVFDMEQGVEMGRRSSISVAVELDQAGTAVSKVTLAGKSVLVQEGIIRV